LTGRRADRLEKLKQELSSEHVRVFVYQMDVSKLESVQEFFAAIPDDFKEIDILVRLCFCS
jgi:NADP-dependent 3-hydroxy acid dehydrogenase YdfG